LDLSAAALRVAAGAAACVPHERDAIGALASIRPVDARVAPGPRTRRRSAATSPRSVEASRPLRRRRLISWPPGGVPAARASRARVVDAAVRAKRLDRRLRVRDGIADGRRDSPDRDDTLRAGRALRRRRDVSVDGIRPRRYR
jgi:hypothetical protein